MKRPFSYLRGCLTRENIIQEYLCEYLKRSKGYVTQRMTAKKPWSQEEQYKLMDLCHIPYNEMHLAFPKGGFAN